MAAHRSRRRNSRDDHAGELIEEMCVERAWSLEDLARETERIARLREQPRLAVSRRSIERVVFDGHVPGARVKCGIALALGLAPWQLWGAGALPLAHQRPAPLVVAA